MDTTQLSFRGDAALKAIHVAQAEQHARADMLIAGTYGDVSADGFRGCSVGCFAHEIQSDAEDGYHQIVADARGLPEWLIRLQDSIFEGLPAAERANFHVDLAGRIPVGVDLAPVRHWIAIARIDRMLVTQRAALEADHPSGVRDAITQVFASLEIARRAHEAAAGGNVCELPAARSAARSAAESAESAARSAWSAWSAAWSAAESAESAARSAWSAAESAESAARSAWSAESAARSAWSAARSAAWMHERDALFVALDRAGVR